ncbi:hypothetical protein SUGI_0866950 [Cryptomeria japonica]|nr:hypothetical protein SUGI_0866950 [Cryptomeria japonica]
MCETPIKSSLNVCRLSSWRGLNCCEWEGVACDYHTSHVIRLDLSNQGYYDEAHYDYWYNHQLSGELCPLLFNLQHLQHLDLSGNDFEGVSIPLQLSNLPSVTFLSLSNAGFGGEVPLELGNMSSLQHLDISGNDCLTISMLDAWVSKLISLEFLDMSEVNLTMVSQHWGEALTGLPNLTQIHLSDCGLSGNIPDLSNLTHLSHLDLSLNSFPFELPSWFENVSSLVSLDLQQCDLNGYILSNFMPHSELRNLVLTFNLHLKGSLSFILNNSSSLVVLSLGSCNLTGAIPPSIANFSKLETLDLSHNSLQGGVPSSYDNLFSLATLDLTYNQLTGQIPPSLCQLPTLSELRLGHNQLLGTIPDCIYKLVVFPPGVPWIEILQYRRRVTCIFSQQYLLKELNLSNNNIVGNLPLSLWDLPNLLLLNLSNNQLEGFLPQQISHNFWGVNLHGNKLYGSLPALDFVTYLLDQSDNEFNGSIPARIGTSTFLLLSRNNLTGEIPNFTFIDSNYLVNLDLSKSKLTGMIPTSIGSCSQLSVLKLAQNSLQREIPEELGNLQTLRALNLNGNRLEGIIPSSIVNCTGFNY